jgi:hypothetical protein
MRMPHTIIPKPTFHHATLHPMPSHEAPEPASLYKALNHANHTFWPCGHPDIIECISPHQYLLPSTTKLISWSERACLVRLTLLSQWLLLRHKCRTPLQFLFTSISRLCGNMCSWHVEIMHKLHWALEECEECSRSRRTSQNFWESWRSL